MTHVDLSKTSDGGYRPGRPFAVRAIWLVCEALILSNPLVTSYPLKRWLLRRFGARIGSGVVIKPGVKVKYPWRLVVGEQCWIGEQAWIDNMEDVTIGSNVVISQGAYLCTGNHDWTDPGMRLAPSPITLHDGAWICAWARVAPGRTVEAEAIVGFGAVLLTDAEVRGVYVGNPATKTATRMSPDELGSSK